MKTDNDFINWFKREYPQIKMGPIFSALQVLKIYHRYIEMKKNHGGKRKGAGRKPKEPTVVIRIPKSKLVAVKNLLNPK